MPPGEQFFVALAERRLELSLNRLHAADNRALGLLGLVAVLMTGLWALHVGQPRPGRLPVSQPRGMMAVILLGLALILAGSSLLMTAQYDSPDIRVLDDRWGREFTDAYPQYLASVVMAIDLNTAVAQRKSLLLLFATLALFLGVMAIVL